VTNTVTNNNTALIAALITGVIWFIVEAEEKKKKFEEVHSTWEMLRQHFMSIRANRISHFTSVSYSCRKINISEIFKVYEI
jgi:hypothetical protein